MKTNIIFPALCNTRKIEPFWLKEAEAAGAAGFGISLLKDHNEAGPAFITNNKAENYIYRGWIIKPSYYKEMCEVAKGPLLNNVDNYLSSYDFPKWYSAFSTDDTPSSVIYTAEEVRELGLSEISLRVSEYVFRRRYVRIKQSQALIVKDFLKSRKHEWFDACFIKDAYVPSETFRVLQNFFKLQGRDFYGGLVFRDFLNLKKLGQHPKTGMPLPVEFRTFFINQKPIITTRYWQNDIEYPEEIKSPPQDWLEYIGKKLLSPFVALDIAQSDDDKWWVIEVNDGGSAGYPEHLDPKDFYKLLFQSLST